VHAGRDSSNADALSLERTGESAVKEQNEAEGKMSANEDKEAKSSVNLGDHLVDIKQADMIEKLGREIAKTLAHALEDRDENHNAVLPATVESTKNVSEVGQQQKDQVTGAGEVKSSGDGNAAVASDLMKTDGNDGLLELAEQLVHKLQHHGGDRKKQSDSALHSSLATTATGVLEHSASSQQDARHNTSWASSSKTPKQVHVVVQLAIQHKRPSFESRMKDVASDLMQLKTKVALQKDVQKDTMGFAHALDMFQSIEASAKPCVDFKVIDKKMHATPVGSLSRVEFLQICKKDDVYERIDLDGSGKIDEKEYTKACQDKIIDGSSLSLASLNIKSDSMRSASLLTSLILLVVLSAVA